ncbi:zinc ribbon domain-containing protein [Quadrisphaera sp. DSM 44207]|uniref:zinc ribbon domain-containing protein n=1 Tax=Quadrisphaera sp. DSM 44207 TaxID=1881057 RepID=UPI0008813455|nr:C4-type zinc ribbon domain-containing protein [Quadrisphaera sp. DSM 44207]SDQ04214.1 hypothetical protein SAMN05428996_0094 [Quadrisphaera sp. DSM 44207]
MTTAPATDQRRLLGVQALDTRLAQLAHRRRALPEHAALAELEQRRATVRDRLVAARTLASDVQRELVRAEQDVEQVRTRAARDAARLAAGTGTAKDLQALVKDSEALARRQSDLEDVELEVMERLEQAQAAAADLEQQAAQLEAERTRLVAARDTATTAIDAEAEQLRLQRAGAVQGLDAGLVALYERVRESSGGLGAAPLQGDRCGGCRLQLNPVELTRIRRAERDEVVRCEECGRILVRVPEGAEGRA